jgi:ankyrin repeat protein
LRLTESIGDLLQFPELLNDHINVTARDENGRTVLHSAAYNRHKEIVEILLANGAKIDAANIYGGTALHCAMVYGHKEIVEILTVPRSYTDSGLHKLVSKLQIKLHGSPKFIKPS